VAVPGWNLRSTLGAVLVLLALTLCSRGSIFWFSSTWQRRNPSFSIVKGGGVHLIVVGKGIETRVAEAMLRCRQVQAEETEEIDLQSTSMGCPRLSAARQGP